MTSLVLYVGIAVAFLTVWGVIMVGAYMLGDASDDAPAVADGRMIDTSTAGGRLR